MSIASNSVKGKKPGFWVVSAFILSLGLLSVSAFYTFEIIRLSEERNRVKYDMALLNDVKYGVFDINVWKAHMGEMLKDKIDEFELSSSDRKTIKAEIERLLYQLIKEINKIFKKEAYSGLHGLFKGLLYEIFVDVEDMKRRVPEFADQILAELDKPQNLKTFKEIIHEKIEEAFTGGYEGADREEIKAIYSKYSCSEIESCNAVMSKSLNRVDNGIKDSFVRIIVPVVFIFFFLFLVDDFGKIKVPIMVFSCVVLLAGGILIPMIEIDARVESISFDVLGGTLSFENQILYYQSKSITEVVELLTRTGKWDLIGVGMLILAFSVIFPVLKLFSTLFLPWFPNALRKNRITRFLIYRSGKWSLADVLVVALFMAYIGFRGVVDSQFSDLQTSLVGPEVLTTNHTALQVGFTLFFCFCLGSVLVSWLVGMDYEEEVK